jgi:hypothetical protein
MIAESQSSPPDGRAAGIGLVLAAVATCGLLINHPAVTAHTFAEVLKSEAANQVMDGVVHGGFIVVMSIQLVCLSVLSLRIGLLRPPVLSALLFAVLGIGFLGLSMLVDGFVTPAVASRYLEATDKVDFAKSLFVLIGGLLGVLMPLGLLFQSVSVLLWSCALLRSNGIGRAIAIGGMTVVLLIVVGAVWTAFTPHVLIAALIGLGLWYAAVGIGLTSRRL